MKLARKLADWTVRIAPASRRSWAEAIRAELDHVPPGRAWEFSAGGLLAAARFRAFDPAFLETSARYVLAGAGLVWAAMAFRLGLELHGGGVTLGAAMLFVNAGVFGVGGLATALAGLRITVLLGLPTLAAAGLYAAVAGELLTGSPHSAFYRALAIEDFAALLLAVVIAAGVRQYSRCTPAS